MRNLYVYMHAYNIHFIFMLTHVYTLPDCVVATRCYPHLRLRKISPAGDMRRKAFLVVTVWNFSLLALAKKVSGHQSFCSMSVLMDNSSDRCCPNDRRSSFQN